MRILFNPTTTFNNKTPFKSRPTNTVTKETILEMQNAGKSFKEILKELNISEWSYSCLLSKFGIKTKAKLSKEKIALITKEILQDYINKKISVTEICKELDIPERTYSRLLDKFGLKTERKKAKQNATSITKEKLQKLVDNKLSVTEICEKLKIDKSTFYRTLKRLNIKYSYQKHSREIQISKERLQELAESGKTTKEIARELGISVTTYHQKVKEYNIKTILRDSIDKIQNINIEEIQNDINNKIKIKDLCQKYNITNSTYSAIIRKYSLDTPTRTCQSRISKTSKDEILKLKNAGYKPKEICTKLEISETTYYRLINAHI